MSEAKATALHYARCGYGRTLIVFCDDQLKKRGQDPFFVFWRAFGSAREGNFSAAVRDCEALRGRRESEYAALVAMAHYHRRSKLVDRDALAGVDATLAGAWDSKACTESRRRRTVARPP
jgi:hypothetical protein